MRNNSGGRNYGDRNRDHLNSITGGTFDRGRDDLSSGIDLRVRNNSITSRTLESGNKNRDLTTVNKVTRNDKSNRNDVTTSRNPGLLTSRDNDIIRNNSSSTRNKKQLGLRTNASTKNYVRKNQKNDVVKELGVRNNNTYRTDRNYSNNDVRRSTNKSNTNYKPDVKRNSGKNNNPRTYSPPKGNDKNPPRNYSPPKRNNNPPRTYSPPRTNNNPPRSYNPPRNNTPPRTNNTPHRSGGNSGGRRR